MRSKVGKWLTLYNKDVPPFCCEIIKFEKSKKCRKCAQAPMRADQRHFLQLFSVAPSLKTTNLEFFIRKLFWRGLTDFGPCLHRNWTDLETSPRGFSAERLNQGCGEPIKFARREDTIKPALRCSVRGWIYKTQDKMKQTSMSMADIRGWQSCKRSHHWFLDPDPLHSYHTIINSCLPPSRPTCQQLCDNYLEI